MRSVILNPVTFQDEQIGNVGRSVESLSVESILTLESQSIVLAGISSPNASKWVFGKLFWTCRKMLESKK